MEEGQGEVEKVEEEVGESVQDPKKDKSAEKKKEDD